MKSLLLFLSLTLTIGLNSQSTLDKTMTSGGITRDYKLYVPASYDGTTPVALVLNLHGLGSNSNQQMFYGDFRPIADTANFIIVHPQGTTDATSGSTYWNAYFGTSVDDIGFLSELIDTISSNYNIDINRVHSTGMSNGGYMSLALAAGLHDKIASVASVTGSMTHLFPNTPVNTKPIAVLQIHGTADSTVKYAGDANSKSIPNVLNYWIGHNNATTTPVIDSIPNTNTTDNSTAIRYTYGGGVNNTEVIHYKVVGGEHTWPGSAYVIGVTNKDFSASKVIWDFFNKHHQLNTVDVNSIVKKELNVNFFYNNSTKELNLFKTEKFNVAMQYSIYSMDGKIIKKGEFLNDKMCISINSLRASCYVLRIVETKSNNFVAHKFVVE